MPPEPATSGPAWVMIAAALALALVHVVAPTLRFLRGTPRSVWLSLAGGVSVAYVFVHLLPELAAGQREVSDALAARGPAPAGGVLFAERHVYLLALAGLAIFYGLDRLAKRSRSERSGRVVRDGRDEGAEGAGTSPGVFRVHMASFGVYNALVGYLVFHRERSGIASLLFFTVAMALHFVVNDFGLLEDHREPFRRVGRWILAVALLAGAGIGAATELPKAGIAALLAVLAGGVILNVLKEEVPSERQSRFWAFALGMAAYATLLLTL